MNINHTSTEDDLMCFSVTTAHRAGSFNLGCFSFISTYDAEGLITNGLGYKGQTFDGTVRLNVSTYR